MIKAIIIDDEDYVRFDIRERLEEFFEKEIEIVGEASSVEES